jgi:hypothetical protein
VKFPDTRVVPRQLSIAAQFAALRDDTLDVGLVRERPGRSRVQRDAGVQEEARRSDRMRSADDLIGPDGVRLDALRRVKWVGFPRSAAATRYRLSPS